MNPLARILTDAAAIHGDRVALVEHGPGGRREASYAEVLEQALRGAAELRAGGIQPGDRVLLCAANSLEFPPAFFAAIMAGATLVPAPILSSRRELTFRIRHAGCRAALCDEERAEAVAAAADSAGCELSRHDVATLGKSAGLDAPDLPVDVGTGAIGLVLYTSGTTGTPRGAAIAHETLVGHTKVIGIDALGLGAEDVILGVLPFTHSYGCRTAMLTSFLAGARCVLMARFEAAEALQLAIVEDATFIPAVPTMFARWGVLPDGPRPRNLRLCLAAGAPLADEIVHRAEARLGTEIRQAYGMTEATLATIDAPPGPRKLGSVGKAAPDSDVRIIDTEGSPCPAGSRGEILIRGGGVMAGYLDDDTATAGALKDGWMHTGDIGWFDEDACLHVVGRIKDMIIRGGNNIYPAELEGVLNELPEVASAAVIGRPHATHGEEVVAILELVEGAALDRSSLDAFAADSFARNKRPREWIVVEAMPLGPSNKILKRVLREQLLAGDLEPLS